MIRLFAFFRGSYDCGAMSFCDEKSDLPPQEPSGKSPEQGKFLLSRLSAAFAQMTGAVSPVATPEAPQPGGQPPKAEADRSPEDAAPVTPRMIVEGMLFVGFDDGRPLTGREMASHIRDVTPAEVDAIVEELNQLYGEQASAYEIASVAGGYRMQLREEFGRVRERFHGRVREAKLTPAAMEVLSIVAYKQPVTAEQVQQLRGSRSQAVLSQLVRRELLRLERPTQSPRKPWYRTTERFNRLFKLSSLDDLPHSEDLDDA